MERKLIDKSNTKVNKIQKQIKTEISIYVAFVKFLI